MAIFRRCNTCHGIFKGKECPTCAAKRQKSRLDEVKSRKLYASHRWRKCRENAIIRYAAYDIWKMGIGVVIQCRHPVVHHIVKRDEAPELIYNLDNLITCTNDSHAEIHEAYRKNKKAALARIRRGIETYKELFHD